jgi:hypothetical protein
MISIMAQTPKPALVYFVLEKFILLFKFKKRIEQLTSDNSGHNRCIGNSKSCNVINNDQYQSYILYIKFSNCILAYIHINCNSIGIN